MKTIAGKLAGLTALALGCVLGCAGLILLFADIADESPLVQGIGWLPAFALTKGAAALTLWLCYIIHVKLAKTFRHGN